MTNFSRILNALSGLYSEEKNQYIDSLNQYSLLIIDDLGTELTNSFVSSQLFLCINERIMRRKSTIISTNLTLQKFLGYLFRENIFPNCQQLSDDIVDREGHPYTENIFRRKLKWHR